MAKVRCLDRVKKKIRLDSKLDHVKNSMKNRNFPQFHNFLQYKVQDKYMYNSLIDDLHDKYHWRDMDQMNKDRNSTWNLNVRNNINSIQFKMQSNRLIDDDDLITIESFLLPRSDRTINVQMHTQILSLNS